MNWWYEDDQYGYSQEAMVLLTPYAIANGYEYGVTQDDFDFYNLYEKGYDDACIGEYYGNWWLRSIDCGGTGACIVTRIGHFGRFFVSGTQYSKSGVRPALYLLYEQ